MDFRDISVHLEIQYSKPVPLNSNDTKIVQKTSFLIFISK